MKLIKKINLKKLNCIIRDDFKDVIDRLYKNVESNFIESDKMEILNIENKEQKNKIIETIDELVSYYNYRMVG